MLHRFSKNVLVLLALVGLFSSCDKDKDSEPATSITILGSDYVNFAKVGSKATYKTLDKSKINELPVAGENQVWDLKVYEMSAARTLTNRDNLPVPSGTSFTSATFVRTQQSEFISAFTFTEFYEMSDEGYYRIGLKVDAGTANLGNGITLSSTGDENPLTPKDLRFKFPMTYNDINSSEAVLRETYQLTAPAFGLSNAPVERKLTYPTKSEVVGWGKVLLPQGAITESIEVVLVKNTETVIANYFLNGSTAPAALLNPLGLTENTKNTSIFYYFISKEFGVVADFGFDADENGNAIFPAVGATYTVSR